LASTRTENKVEGTPFSVYVPDPKAIPNPVCLKCDGREIMTDRTAKTNCSTCIDYDDGGDDDL